MGELHPFLCQTINVGGRDYLISVATEIWRHIFCNNPDDIAHYDMRFVKPLNGNLLHSILKKYKTIITVEDNAIRGGFGSTVLEFASSHNYKVPIKLLGIPDNFIEHGSVDELQHAVGLNAESLTKYFKSLLKFI